MIHGNSTLTYEDDFVMNNCVSPTTPIYPPLAIHDFLSIVRYPSVQEFWVHFWNINHHLQEMLPKDIHGICRIPAIFLNTEGL